MQLICTFVSAHAKTKFSQDAAHIESQASFCSWQSYHSLSRNTKMRLSPRSCALTTQLISAIVFATHIVQSLYFLNLKFQASNHLLWQYSLVCVRPGRKPWRQVFSHQMVPTFSMDWAKPDWSVVKGIWWHKATLGFWSLQTKSQIMSVDTEKQKFSTYTNAKL